MSRGGWNRRGHSHLPAPTPTTIISVTIAIRRVEHPYLVFQHICHRIVFEVTTPAGVGVFEVSYHVFVYVQVFLQEILDFTAGRVGEIYVGMGLVEDPTTGFTNRHQ